MANALWDASLPQDLLVDGYEERFPNGKLRTEMETGPAKQRRRFTAAPQPLKAQQEMTRAQVATLLTFYRETLAMGSLPFDWTNQRTQATATLRFVSEPIARPLPGAQVWAVEYDLEIMP